jgi:hypothetical protein
VATEEVLEEEVANNGLVAMAHNGSAALPVAAANLDPRVGQSVEAASPLNTFCANTNHMYTGCPMALRLGCQLRLGSSLYHGPSLSPVSASGLMYTTKDLQHQKKVFTSSKSAFLQHATNVMAWAI